MSSDTLNARKSDRLSLMGLLHETAGYVDGMNLYEMEESNPVNRVDPFGLDSSTQPGTQPTTQPTFNLNFNGSPDDFGNSHCYALRPTGIKNLKVTLKWKNGLVQQGILAGMGGVRGYLQSLITDLARDEAKQGGKLFYTHDCPKGYVCTNKHYFHGDTPFSITFNIKLDWFSSVSGTITGTVTVEGFLGDCTKECEKK